MLQEAQVSTMQTTPASIPTPPELEQTLATLSAHRTVLGYLLLARSSQPLRIIRHSGVVFDGENGRKYARSIAKIVDAVRVGLDEATDSAEPDDVRFMRIRTKRYELMISPDEHYLLAVLHDPTS